MTWREFVESKGFKAAQVFSEAASVSTVRYLKEDWKLEVTYNRGEKFKYCEMWLSAPTVRRVFRADTEGKLKAMLNHVFPPVVDKRPRKKAGRI